MFANKILATTFLAKYITLFYDTVMITIGHEEILNHDIVAKHEDNVPSMLAGLIAGKEWQVIEGGNIVPTDTSQEVIEALAIRALDCIIEKPPTTLWSPVSFLPGLPLPEVRWTSVESIFMGTNTFSYSRRSMIKAHQGKNPNDFEDIIGGDILLYRAYFYNSRIRFR
jgi:hypothetical protein